MERVLSVILAEDMQPLREYFAELIDAQPDMRVAAQAASGAEIERIALAQPFDICLMDVEMESRNAGIHAAERIVEAQPGAKIIYLTIHETREIILSAMATGAVDYILKDSPEEEILGHIRAAAQGRPRMNPEIASLVTAEYSRIRRSERNMVDFITTLSRLTTAERELINYMLQGCTVSEMARLRSVEKATVKSQVKSILRKFSCARSREIVESIRALGIESLFMR